LKKLLALIYTFLFSLPLFAQERLVFSTFIGHPLVGFSGQIVREAYQKIGIEVEIQQYPASRALAIANRGDVDGELGRVAGINKTFTNLLMVPVAISSIDGVIFTKDTHFPVLGWESLKPYKVGLVRGTHYVEEKTVGMDRLILTESKQLFGMLQKGRIDVAVMDRVYGLIELKHNQMKNIRVMEPPLAKHYIHHYIHKKHASLLPSVTQAFQEMQQSGRILFLNKQFFSELQK
jgi:polar amino acid transport system substrate-binding protein